MPKPLNKTVHGAWLSYRMIVMRSDVPQVQVTETRRAFYAGVLMMLNLLDEVSTPDVSEDEGAAYIERLAQECRDFTKKIGTGDF